MHIFLHAPYIRDYPYVMWHMKVWRSYAGLSIPYSQPYSSVEWTGEPQWRLLSVRDTRSSDHYVFRHNMCTKGGNYLGSRGAGDRMALV